MAARAMGCGGDGESGVVTSCESYLPMVKLMKKVLRLNAMQKRVIVINKRSDELSVGSDIPSRAHVLVSVSLLDSQYARRIKTKQLSANVSFDLGRV